MSIVGHTTDSNLFPTQQQMFDELYATSEFEELMEQYFNDTKVVLFGESYGGNINKGKTVYGPEKVKFILFDVYFPESDTYMRHYDGTPETIKGTVEEVAQELGLDVVPVMKVGKLQDLVDYVKTRPLSVVASKNNVKSVIEGLVATPKCQLYKGNKDRVIVKIKVKDLLGNGKR